MSIFRSGRPQRRSDVQSSKKERPSTTVRETAAAIAFFCDSSPYDSCILGPCFEYKVERGLGGATKSFEPSTCDYVPYPSLTRLRPKTQPDFL